MSSAITTTTEANAPAARRGVRVASGSRGSVGETGAATVPTAAGTPRVDRVLEAPTHPFVGEGADLALIERARSLADSGRPATAATGCATR